MPRPEEFEGLYTVTLYRHAIESIFARTYDTFESTSSCFDNLWNIGQ